MNDLISRQAAIDAAALSAAEWDGMYVQDINGRIREALEQLPSAQPVQWIPCSERLPDGKGYVLVTDYGETNIGRRFDKRWLDYFGDKMKDVTAWMPLPEPYKAESEDKEWR